MSTHRAIGAVAGKDGFAYCEVSGPPAQVVDEVDIALPSNIKDRAEQLEWLLSEATELFKRVQPNKVFVKRAGAGPRQASPERYEVDAVLQLAARAAQVEIRMMPTESIRAMHVPRGKGAYDSLLKLPEVKARSNAQRRELFLYAMSALKGLDG